jgi:shikimate kinase
MNKKELEKRPLFQDINKARELFNKRDKIYSKLADVIIVNNNLENTLKQIKEYYASNK